MAISLAISSFIGFQIDIRFDEGYTLNTTSRGIAYAITQSLGFEEQAPLYFVLLSIWRMADSSLLFARLFSILMAPLIVWATAETAKRYIKDLDPLLPAAVMAVSSQMIWSSIEIRLYALMLLLSCLILITFYDAFLTTSASYRRVSLFILVCIAAIYTQYFLGFLMVGCGIVILIAARQSFRSFALSTVVITLASLPIIYIMAGQASEVHGHSEGVFGGIPLIRSIYQLTTAMIIPLEWITNDLLRSWAIRLFAFVVFIVLIVRLTKRPGRETVALTTITFVTLILLLTANYYLGNHGIQHRHFSVALIPLVLITFAAFQYFKSRSVSFGLAAMLMIANLGHVVWANWDLAKPGDAKRVASYITDNESENEPVLIFHADAVLSIREFYRGKNQLVPLPQENSFDEWDPRNNVIRSEEQLSAAISNASRDAKRFWLVNDGWCAQGTLKFNCEILEDFISKNFQVIAEREFLKPTTVRLIERR